MMLFDQQCLNNSSVIFLYCLFCIILNRLSKKEKLVKINQDKQKLSGNSSKLPTHKHFF